MSLCNVGPAQGLSILGLDNLCDAACIPQTIGKPTTIPESCDSMVQYDPASGSFWAFVCGVNDWIELGQYTNCSLTVLDTTTIGDVCAALSIPVVADTVGGCANGTVTVATLAAHIAECLCAGMAQDGTEADSALACDGAGGLVERPITPFCDTVAVSASEATEAITCDPVSGQPVVHPITPICDQVSDDATVADSALDCVNGSLVRRPLAAPPTPTALPACVDTTIGQPQNTPDTTAGDNIFAYDPCEQKFWFYTCDNGWQVATTNLCDLGPIDEAQIADICNDLRIPVFYDAAECCVEGYLDLARLAELVCECHNCPILVFGSNNAQGGSCLHVTSMANDPEPLVIQGRDTSVISGTGAVVLPTPTAIIYAQLDVVNPFPDDALLTITWEAHAMMNGIADSGTIDEAFTFIASPDLNLDYLTINNGFISPGNGGIYNNTDVGYGEVTIPRVETGSFDDNGNTRRVGSTTIVVQKRLTPGEAYTGFLQYWYTARSMVGFDGATIIHGNMYSKYTITRGLV